MANSQLSKVLALGVHGQESKASGQQSRGGGPAYERGGVGPPVGLGEPRWASQRSDERQLLAPESHIRFLLSDTRDVGGTWGYV